MGAAVRIYRGAMPFIFRLCLVAGAICLAIVGGSALATGQFPKVWMEIGLISAIVVFVFVLGSAGPSAGLKTGTDMIRKIAAINPCGRHASK